MEQKETMVVDCIAWLLSNFGLAMFFLAAVFILLHRMIRRNVGEAEIVFRWVALFGLGLTGIYTFVMHAFYPEFTAATIGWRTSPFQFEVAMADLAFGVLGVLSFRASYGFRLATVIGSLFWLWGDAAGHMWQMIEANNYSLGNAESWLWVDLIIPLVLLLSILKMKNER